MTSWHADLTLKIKTSKNCLTIRRMYILALKQISHRLITIKFRSVHVCDEATDISWGQTGRKGS